MSRKLDEFYITRSLELARGGAGHVSPNPLVGAVLVKNKKIIGEGYHRKYGESHAEVIAIESATESVRGATLYCNLEPCSHFNKKTPPCAQRIIKEGISRVVISNLDPNPYVNGQGVRIMSEAGISIDIGILESNGAELNRFFFKYIKLGIPYITIKIAQTINGYITRCPGSQTWISGEESRKLVHQWRSEYDSVLIGAGTVITDNPKLDVRLVSGRNPFRIVLDPRLKITTDHNITRCDDPDKTILITSTSVEQKKLNQVKETNCTIKQLPTGDNGLFKWDEILKYLGALSITSTLIEGGQHIFSQVISERLYDDMRIFIAPKIWGNGLPVISNQQDVTASLHLYDSQKIGQDILLSFLPN